MPKGPRGEIRPSDVIKGAVLCAKIATGEIEDIKTTRSGRSKSGKMGALARKNILTREQRREVAKKAASARWTK